MFKDMRTYNDRKFYMSSMKKIKATSLKALWIVFELSFMHTSFVQADSISPAPTPSTTAPEIPNPASWIKRKKPITDINLLHPQFGFQLFAAPWLINTKNTGFFNSQGFTGGQDASGNNLPANPTVSSIGLLFDYQPEFLQFFGAVDLGVSYAMNFVFPGPNTYVGSADFLQTVGFQVKYQLRLYPGQPIVPVVGYFADLFLYSFSGPNSTGGTLSGRSWIQGPMAGVWLLINWMEPAASRDLYINSGFSRSYLTFEARQMSSGGPSFAVTGSTYLFGLRVEI
jgi:hypothetical protein